MDKLKPLIKYCDLFLSDSFVQACETIGETYDERKRRFSQKAQKIVKLSTTGHFLGYKWHDELTENYDIIIHVDFLLGNGTTQTIKFTWFEHMLTFVPQNVTFRDNSPNVMRNSDTYQIMALKKTLEHFSTAADVQVTNEEKMPIIPSPPSNWLTLAMKKEIELKLPGGKKRARSWRMGLYHHEDKRQKGSTAETLAEVIRKHSDLASNFVDMGV